VIPKLHTDPEATHALQVKELTAPWHAGKKTPLVDVDELFAYPVNECAPGEWGFPSAEELKDKGVVERHDEFVVRKGPVHIAIGEHPSLLCVRG
jgi:hypothetical protein